MSDCVRVVMYVWVYLICGAVMYVWVYLICGAVMYVWVYLICGAVMYVWVYLHIWSSDVRVGVPPYVEQ